MINSTDQKQLDFEGDEVLTPDEFAKIRMIDFGLFLGSLTVLWTPFVVTRLYVRGSNCVQCMY